MIPHPFPWCNGAYLSSLRTPEIPVYDKYSGTLLASVPQSTSAEHDQFIHAALSGMQQLAQIDVQARADIFLKVADLLSTQKEFYASLIVAEAGKPIQLARVEVDRCIATLKAGAREVMWPQEEVIPIDFGRGAGKRAFTARFPAGPVLAFSPFNFPLNLALHKVVPALAAGCSIVLKAPPQSPLSMLSLAALFAEAGLPPGALNVTVCSNEVALQLLMDERFAVFSFTGSDQVGWMLKSKAGKKRCILELGGNAAAIVDETSDLADAARQIAYSAFMYAGQVCISTQRIYVVDEVADAFRDLLLSETAKIRSGNPAEDYTLNGPLISAEALRRIEQHLAEAIRGGAQVLSGARALQFEANLYAPTLLTNTTPEMSVNRDEVFGPVATLEVCRNAAHAIELAGNSRYGLQCGYFSQHIGRIKSAFNHLRTGSLIVNAAPGFRMDHMPYGGLGDSGIGLEGIRYAMQEMTETRLLVF